MKTWSQWLLVLVCGVCLSGCGPSEDEGHKTDTTPPGETNVIEDMDPDKIQDMDMQEYSKEQAK